ncbi:MAG: DUF1460 domain-containing protein [Gemmatimonadetes bacterium]|nr:DUF1460 domain-containing protein [Gemmatimonadota bacterium]
MPMLALALLSVVGVGGSGTANPRDVAGVSDTIPGTNWTATDYRIFEEKVRWGVARGLARDPLGRAIARLGETFVGARYTPGTLEVPGPERLVINLRELDCVTFVENVLALVRFIRHDGIAGLGDPALARARFEEYLRGLRYRGGILAGYPSRLHYFSEWLADNERRGNLRQVSRDLGGRLDREPIDFMSAHPGSYRQLADSLVLEEIRSMEKRLSAADGRWFLPEGRIAAAARRIKDGDLIAATSTLAGLDVAHTGFALWKGGRLHLLHAPLVGKSVEISVQPLAARIVSIKSQDGIMVARPVELSRAAPPVGTPGRS